MNKYFGAAVWLAILISACSDDNSVHAPVAASGDPISLPKLMSAFMVPANKSPEWSMGATSLTSEIIWQSVGVETQACGSFASCRRGTARVSVLGKELQNLRQRLEPVKWELFLASSGAEKFGPEEIMIHPSCDTVDCNFDFEKGMADSGIKLDRLCDSGAGISSQKIAYQLTQGEYRAIAVIDESLGSGGRSTSLTIHFAKPDKRDWCAEARADTNQTATEKIVATVSPRAVEQSELSITNWCKTEGGWDPESCYCGAERPSWTESKAQQARHRVKKEVVRDNSGRISRIRVHDYFMPDNGDAFSGFANIHTYFQSLDECKAAVASKQLP